MTRIAFLGLLLMAYSSHAAIFKFRLLAEPQTLDWHLASTSIETPLLMNMMEGLMEVDANLRPKPCLAEKMEISKDLKTYTFKLRKGVKWSDGVPLKAQDFVEGWKRLLTPATAAPYAYLLNDIVGAEEYNKKTITDFTKVAIHASDESTLVVSLKKPVAYFPFLTGFWPTFPIRKDLIDQYGAAWTRPGKMVTVGAFNLESYQLQSKITLKANPHYWRKSGNITEAVGMIITDSATALNLFKAGTIQMMQDFSPDDLKLARPMPEFKTFPYLKTHYIAFRVKGASTENVHLRLALAEAIDRRPIPSILNGAQKLASTFIPPKVIGHDPKLSIPFDVTKAKAEFALSGYNVSKPIEIVARNSERPKILAQYIQSELKKNLGVKVDIQMFDHKVFRSQIDTHNYDMMLMVWAADYPDGDSFLGLFVSNTGNNFAKFSNAIYDEDIAKAREEWNSLKRDNLYKSAQEILQIRDAAVVPLFYEENEALVAKDVKGFSVNPIGYFYLKDMSL